MRIEITPEPTPEERAAIVAALEKLYGRHPSPASLRRSNYEAAHVEERRGWRELAKREALGG